MREKALKKYATAPGPHVNGWRVLKVISSLFQHVKMDVRYALHDLMSTAVTNNFCNNRSVVTFYNQV